MGQQVELVVFEYSQYHKDHLWFQRDKYKWVDVKSLGIWQWVRKFPGKDLYIFLEYKPNYWHSQNY